MFNSQAVSEQLFFEQSVNWTCGSMLISLHRFYWITVLTIGWHSNRIGSDFFLLPERRQLAFVNGGGFRRYKLTLKRSFYHSFFYLITFFRVRLIVGSIVAGIRYNQGLCCGWVACADSNGFLHVWQGFPVPILSIAETLFCKVSFSSTL